MADVLASASLILTALALLYTAWHPDIEEAHGFSVARPYPDAEYDHDRLRAVLHGRALPLGIVSAIMTLIVLPESVWVCRVSLGVVCSLGLIDALSQYDLSSATLIFVQLLSTTLSVHLWTLTAKLIRKNRQFEDLKRRYVESRST